MANSLAQSVEDSGFANGTTIACVVNGAALTNGSLLVARFSTEAINATPTCADDVNSGNYAVDGSATSGASGGAGVGTSRVFSKPNTSTASSATVTVTQGTADYGHLIVYELLGTPSSNYVDVVATDSGNSGTPNEMSVDITPQFDNSTIIVAAEMYPGLGSAVDTGFTASIPSPQSFLSYHHGEHLIDAGTAQTRTLAFGSPSTPEAWSLVAVAYKTGQPPAITAQPTDQFIADGATGTFSVTATGATSYQWETRATTGGAWANVTGGSGATTASYTTPTLSRASDSGRVYRCKITNTYGTTTSNSATARMTNIPTSYSASVGMVIGSGA